MVLRAMPLLKNRVFWVALINDFYSGGLNPLVYLAWATKPN
jgi:hypothetical protein